MSNLAIFGLALMCLVLAIPVSWLYRRKFPDLESAVIKRAMLRGRLQMAPWVVTLGVMGLLTVHGRTDLLAWSVGWLLLLCAAVGFWQLWYFRRHPLSLSNSRSTISTG